MTRTHFSSHIEFNNFKANIMQEPLHNGIALEFSQGWGGTFLYLLYRYWQLQRLWFLRRVGLKTGPDFAYFGVNSGMVFEGIHELICCFNYK